VNGDLEVVPKPIYGGLLVAGIARLGHLVMCPADVIRDAIAGGVPFQIVARVEPRTP
jgi:hypothetical protein